MHIKVMSVISGASVEYLLLYAHPAYMYVHIWCILANLQECYLYVSCVKTMRSDGWVEENFNV